MSMGDRNDDMIEALKKVDVNMENLPIEEVFEALMCTTEGLTSEEAHRRLGSFGYNKHEEKNESKKLQFLEFMIQPAYWVMTVAIIMAIEFARGGERLLDRQDFAWIIVLFILDLIISSIEKSNASNIAATLMLRVGLKSKVLRKRRWSEEDAGILVPGDIISIKVGDIVPADVRLLEGDPVKIDESAVTGESPLVTKGPGASVYSMSTCKQGEIEAVVISTGVHTTFSKSAIQVGHFFKVLTTIAHFCVCSIAVGMTFARLYDI